MGPFSGFIQAEGFRACRGVTSQAYLPFFSDKIVDALVKKSLKFQGTVGDSVTMGMDETSYLSEVYDVRLLDVVSYDAETKKCVMVDDGLVSEHAVVSVEDLIQRSKSEWKDYERIPGKGSEACKPNETMVVHNNKVYSDWTVDNLMAQLGEQDKFLQKTAERPMPVEDDFCELEDFLEASREYRGQDRGTDKMTKRMFGRSGFGATANKFPVRGIKGALHVGSGTYGALSGIGNDCCFIDPVLNGISTFDLKLGAIDCFVISDIAVANGGETGLGPMGEMSGFFDELSCGIAKFRVDDVPAGWRPFSKSRFHNMEVVCGKGFSFPAIGSLKPEGGVVPDFIQKIVTANNRRNLVHQGIYTFPPCQGEPPRAYITGLVEPEDLDTYSAHSLQTIIDHLRFQLRCVSFTPGTASWASCISIADLKEKGTDGTPPDPTMHMPARGMQVILSCQNLSELFSRLPYCGVNQNEAINLTRCFLSMRLSTKGTDYKWMVPGASRGRRNKFVNNNAVIENMYMGALLMGGVIDKK